MRQRFVIGGGQRPPAIHQRLRAAHVNPFDGFAVGLLFRRVLDDGFHRAAALGGINGGEFVRDGLFGRNQRGDFKFGDAFDVIKGEDVDIGVFPTPKWHEDDGGRYIGTDDLVITKDPEEHWVNAGTYRVNKVKVTRPGTRTSWATSPPPSAWSTSRSS